MKAGYVTLFGVVLAFSAYRGTSRSPGGAPSNAGAHAREDLKHGVLVRVPNTDALAAIGAGVCNRAITPTWHDPCDNCGPICPAQDLLDLMQSYFQPQIDGPVEDHPDFAWRVPKSEAKNIKFVVASLADPVHTHMALFFDRQIEAIEKAAQAQGYYFSRSWMPWDISSHPEPTDFTVRMAQADVQSRREKLPGLMIFRKNTQDPEHPTSSLFVFVVGETATGGLHAEQFQNALNIQASILASSPEPQDPSPLLIFGPTFSGSLQSLDALLVHYPGQFSKILMRSGTVSSFSSRKNFCEMTQKQWAAQETQISPEPPDPVTFQFSDKYEEFYLSVFFGDRHQLHSHVAILSEDETQYGTLERPEEPRRADGQQLDQASGPAESRNSCLDEPPKPLLPLIHLYFPREIAQLRDAYQQNVKVQPSLNPEGYVPPRTRLPLTLGVTGNDDDSVPPFANLQTPLSQDAIMQAIVSTLRNQHAKVVIIRASDPLDMVFLARYLRQNYPQARLVTSGADLLMVYDVADPRFHGILAVTSYPLLNGAEFPTCQEGLCRLVNGIEFPNQFPVDTGSKENEDVQRVFPDNYTAGSFNAFLSLLAPGASSTDARQLPDAAYAQFGLPSFLRDHGKWRPHLWLTTVGNDGYWPVSVLDDVPADHINDLALQIWNKKHPGQELQQLPNQIKRPKFTVPALPGKGAAPVPFTVHFTVGWSIFWVVSLALTCALSFFLIWPPNSARSEMLARFSKTCSADRNRLLIMGAILLFLVETLFAFPAVTWLRSFGEHFQVGNVRWFLRTLDFRGVIAYVFEYLTDGIRLVWWVYLLSVLALCGAFGKRFGKRRVAVAAGLIFLVLLAWLTWGVRWQDKNSEFQSFIYRYIQTGSGVSPLLPFFFALAAWLWWCWQSLTGVSSAEEKHIELPSPEKFDALATASKDCAANGSADRMRLRRLADHTLWISGVLKAVPLRIWQIPIFSVLGFLAMCALMNPSEIAEAFESIWYRWIYWYFMLYPCLLLICFLAAHIVGLWLQLRDLLRAIEGVMFRRGFADVKDLTWKPLWKLAGAGRRDFLKVFNQEITVLKRLQILGVTDVKLNTSITEVICQTDQVALAFQNRTSAAELGTLFAALQQKMADTAAAALVFCNGEWNLESYAPPDDSTSENKDESKQGSSEAPAKNEHGLRAVEHFLCLFYLNVILVPLRRLQTLILALAGVFVFVLLSYSSYPFESRESFHALLISILFAISAIVAIVYGQMYSDPLLSRITNTKPGDLGLDFWVKMGTFIFVPVLSLISVQFPEVNSFLFSWLEPALQSIK